MPRQARLERVTKTAGAARLALRVDSTPPQAFSAGFDLRGGPQAGELHLNSPLGNTVASVHWSPQGAELRQGQQLERRATLDELTTEIERHRAAGGGDVWLAAGRRCKHRRLDSGPV